MSTVPILPPAKPYEGRSQHQAVGAAVRSMAAHLGFSYGKRDFRNMTVSVNGRGTVQVDDCYGDAAQIYFSSRNVNLTDRALVISKVTALLRMAGWVVTEASGDGYLNVIGPGAEEWAKLDKERRVESRLRRETTTAKNAAEAEELAAILSGFGVEGLQIDNIGWGSIVTAKLTLEQLQALVEAVREDARSKA